ncbi:Uncharacterised protein [Staphylococcus aureus]|nr:Uncharacterised protein [Staphylococcus aureus]
MAQALTSPIHVVRHARITVIPNTRLPNEPNTRNELYVNISVPSLKFPGAVDAPTYASAK